MPIPLTPAVTFMLHFGCVPCSQWIELATSMAPRMYSRSSRLASVRPNNAGFIGAGRRTVQLDDRMAWQCCIFPHFCCVVAKYSFWLSKTTPPSSMAACCPSAWERGIKLEPSFRVNSTARRCDNTQSHRGTTWDLRASSPCLQLSIRQPETSFCHRTVLACLGERCCCKRLAPCKWGPRSHRLQQPLAQTLARFLPRCFMFLRDADTS